MAHEKVQQSFDEFAGDYQDLLHDPIRDRFANGSAFFHSRKLLLLRSFFASHRIDPKTMSWLDVGCGKGEMLREGLDAFELAAGCDPSKLMLRSCPDLQTRAQPSATEIPYSDKSFDLATLVCVLHHVPPADRPVLIADVTRVLKPGGWLCIIEHNPFNPVTRLIVSRSPIDVDAELLSARQSRQLLTSRRFAIVRTDYFLYLPERLYRKAPLVERALSQLPFGGQYAVFGRLPQV